MSNCPACGQSIKAKADRECADCGHPETLHFQELTPPCEAGCGQWIDGPLRGWSTLRCKCRGFRAKDGE